MPRERYARLATTVEIERVRQGVAGIAVGVIEDGKLTWSQGFGHKDSTDPNSGSVTSATLFRSAVLGTGLTKLLALNLADNGELSVNDELAAYLPNLKLENDPNGWFDRIAIRHLLTWSSGLPRAAERWQESTWKDVGLSQWAESALFSHMYMDFRPGMFSAGYSYAEPRLLALTAERVTGTPFRKLVAERILAPLEMNDTTYLSTDVLAGRNLAIAASPIAAQDSAQAAPVWGPYTTVADMAKYVAFYLNGNREVLSDAYRALAMYRFAHLTNIEGFCGPAFVWHVDYPRCTNNSVPVPVLSMHDSIGGFTTTMYLAPARKFGLMILSNSDSWDITPILKESFKLANVSSTAWKPAHGMDPTHIARFVGNYVTQAPWANPTVAVECAKSEGIFRLTCPLVMKWTEAGQQRLCSLTATGPDTFRCDGVKAMGFKAPQPSFVINPSEPTPDVYGFEVRFVFNVNDTVEYMISAPIVARRLTSIDIAKPTL